MFTVHTDRPGFAILMDDGKTVGYVVRTDAWQHGPHWYAYTQDTANAARLIDDPFAYKIANKVGGMLYPTRKMAIAAFRNA